VWCESCSCSAISTPVDPRVPEDDLERAGDRSDHDQEIEAVAARGRSEPAHASNVLHAVAGRMPPKTDLC
jgi:hypothetical protein